MFFHFKFDFDLENVVPTHVYTLSEPNFCVESFAHTLSLNKPKEHDENVDLLHAAMI